MGRHLDENRAERVTTEDCRTSLFKICLERATCILNGIRRGLPGKGCCPSDQISCVFFSQSHLRGFLHRLHVTYVSPQSPKHPAGLWQDCMCWRINRGTRGPKGNERASSGLHQTLRRVPRLEGPAYGSQAPQGKSHLLQGQDSMAVCAAARISLANILEHSLSF